ncbi:putative ribonuclease H-like domain-containing protein [Tanacetum coccineum]
MDFRVYNIRTRKVDENVHIRFLVDKPIIAGDGPKWLFDIDSLTKSMNYVPVVAGSSKDYIMMPLWKDGSLFDSSSKNASNDEPQPSSDAGKKDDKGVSKESGIDDQEKPENSTQNVNTAGPSINTASTNFNTGSLNINTVSPTVPTAPLEATHNDFFGNDTEVDMSNISTTPVPSTPNTRIHKDHSLDHVIGDVKFGVQTRRMTRTTNKQGFISAVYEGKTHEDLHTFVRIEAIRLFLAYASFKDFVVYQMDMKSVFLYGKIKEEVYVCQPPGFEDPEFPDKVFKMSSMNEITFFLGLQVIQKDDGIFISQDKYVDEILKKFGFSIVKTASTPMETSKPLIKEEIAKDVDVHLYRSMIGSLIIFRYLKGQPKLGLWYPKDSPFDLEAYTDSDYAGASLDRKSTTGVCQFLRRKLIS